jgi:MFS family permease
VGSERAGDSDFRLASLIPSVYLPTLLFTIGQGAILPIIPLYATRELDASAAVASLVFAMWGIGNMAFDLPGGLLETRYGERAVMVGGALILAVVAASVGLADSALHLGVLVLLMGGGQGLWILGRISYVSQEVPVHLRGRALALAAGTNRLGTFVGPLLGAFLGESLGLVTAFYAAAALSGATAVVLAVAVKRRPRQVVVGETRSAHSRLLTTAIDYRGIILTAGLASVALQLLRQSRQVLIPLWGDSIDLDISQIGLIVAFSSAVDSVLFYPAGLIIDRWGRKWSAVPSLIILAVSLTLLPLTDAFAPLFAVGLLAGVGNGLSAGLGMTLAADFAPREARGEFLGVWRLVNDVGTASGPLVVSGVAAIASLGAACIATAGLGGAGALVMYFLVAETLRPPPARAPP